jgi:regulator of protease activity HflC (stomatin/prohibitin superfamily)
MSQKKISTVIAFLGICLIAILFIGFRQSLVDIKQDERGIVISPYEPYGFNQEPLEPGRHLIKPGESVVIYNIGSQTYEMAENSSTKDDFIQAKTKDGKAIQLDVSVTYRINPQTLIDLHIRWQNRYQDNVVRPIVRAATRDAISKFNLSELPARRSEIEADISKQIETIFANNGLIFEKYVIQNIH